LLTSAFGSFRPQRRLTVRTRHLWYLLGGGGFLKQKNLLALLDPPEVILLRSQVEASFARDCPGRAAQYSVGLVGRRSCKRCLEGVHVQRVSLHDRFCLSGPGTHHVQGDWWLVLAATVARIRTQTLDCGTCLYIIVKSVPERLVAGLRRKPQLLFALFREGTAR
jgi:hypothetical protein